MTLASTGSAATPIAPGLYHFLNMDGDLPTRFHLRVDPDGAGMLLANAAEAAHLSPSGVLIVHGVLEGLEDAAITAEVRANFSGAGEAEVAEDLSRVRVLIEDLASPQDNYPITNFGGADESPDARRLGAPFRADVVQGEPSEIEPILARLWEAGIPHVTFLAQPGADMQGLVRLVECAGDIGMITGIRGVAAWFGKQLIHDTAMAGLDHLTLVFASCDPAEHDAMVRAEDHRLVLEAFQHCHELELCPVAQVPLTDESVDELESIIEYVTGQGVCNFSFFAVACLDGEEEADAAGALPARALPQVATVVTEAAEEANARFIWEPPLKFDLRKSLADHIIAGPRTAGDVCIRVEADGSVFPARGRRESAGSILTQQWADIWSNECFTRYRESVEAPGRCATCPDLALCAAACPKDPSGWSDDTEDGDTQ